MQGLILAAGMGKRLGELTSKKPKCMVSVNGVSLLERMVCSLERLSLNKIVIVDGYKSDVLREFANSLKLKTRIEYIENPIFDKTNNIYSLWLAKDFLLSDDTLLLESDIVFENAVLEGLKNDPRPNLALVAKYEDWMDGTCLKLNDDDSIRQFVSGKNFNPLEKSEYFKTVNFYKFSRDFSREIYVPALKEYRKKFGDNEYYESVLAEILNENPRCIFARRIENQLWYEIDNANDLRSAEKIFS